MIFFIVLASGAIIKCVSGVSIPCDAASLLGFSHLAAAGLLELVFEIRGIMSIFVKKDK